MDPNLTNSTPCDPFYDYALTSSIIPVFYLIIPFCIFFGIAGRCVILLAFYRQSKKEPAYFYQITLTTGEVLELVSMAGFCMVVIFHWNPAGSAPWFQRSYTMVWYAAHLANPLIHMTGMVNGFLAIGMAVDRVFAVWKPTKYKNLNHTSIRAGSTALAVLIGVGGSVFDCFRYDDPVFDPSTEEYYEPPNDAFMNTLTATVLSELRVALRIFTLITLIALNLTLLRMYKKQTSRISEMTSDQGSTKSENQKRNQIAQQTLLMLACFDSLFTTIAISAEVAYYVALSLRPSIDHCEGKLWGPVLDATINLAPMAKFYVVLAISKQFRRMIMEYIPCLKKLGQCAHW